MQEHTSFGAWVRHARKDNDLTQEALAEQVGCSVQMIRAIEQDKARPSRQLAELLAQRLDVPAAARPAFVQWARGGPPPQEPAPGPPPALVADGLLEPPRLPLPTSIVTFLGTDIVGSTAAWEREPQAMRAAVARHDALLRAALAASGGQVFHTAIPLDDLAAVALHESTDLAPDLAQQTLLRAARLLGAAETLIDSDPALLPRRRAAHEARVAATRDRLGEAAFRPAWEAGQALPTEQAVAEVLAEAAAEG